MRNWWSREPTGEFRVGFKLDSYNQSGNGTTRKYGVLEMNREGRDEIFVNRQDTRHEGKRGVTLQIAFGALTLGC